MRYVLAGACFLACLFAAYNFIIAGHPWWGALCFLISGCINITEKG